MSGLRFPIMNQLLEPVPSSNGGRIATCITNGAAFELVTVLTLTKYFAPPYSHAGAISIFAVRSALSYSVARINSIRRVRIGESRSSQFPFRVKVSQTWRTFVDFLHPVLKFPQISPFLVCVTFSEKIWTGFPSDAPSCPDFLLLLLLLLKSYTKYKKTE